ncbi:MAG: hypothetical protein JST47_00975 [Bacteroidetes bacterium]|nr:hypothetical protein [Bacteroidota bacterium]
MNRWLQKNIIYIAGALTGAVAGYLYWQEIGCANGTCLITSKPVNSTVYGALMGALIFGLFKKNKAKKNEN